MDPSQDTHMKTNSLSKDLLVDSKMELNPNNSDMMETSRENTKIVARMVGVVRVDQEQGSDCRRS